MTIYDLGPYVAPLLAVSAVLLALGADIVYKAATAKRRLRRAVFANLDSAYEKGYFEPGEYLHRVAARQLTFDLRAFAPDMFEHSADKLLPYVIQWLDRKGLLPEYGVRL